MNLTHLQGYANDLCT